MENNRYKYYQLGLAAEQNNQPIEAIEYYQQYATFLAENDRHIPYLWIHNILFNLARYDEAIDYLLLFCQGCSYPHAAKVLKEKSKLYLSDKPEVVKGLNEKAKEYQRLQKQLSKD